MATPFIIKKGLSSALASQSIVTGTIYFCTDTGEMYIGIADGEKTKITDLSLLNKITELDEELSNFITTTSSNFESQQTKIASITPITLKNYELGSQGESWIRNENNTDSDIVDTSIYNAYIDVPITGVTADMIPEVIFDTNTALSGKFAPIAKTGVDETGEGFVRLYSSSVYTSLTIPIITCRAQGTVIEVTA